MSPFEELVPPPVRRQPVTVLLVDDQPIIAEALRQIFRPEPYITLHYCQDPSGAIEMAASILPTVILQDLVMPGVDGLELARRFRADPRTLDIPLIVLSTREDPVVKAEAFRVGAHDYLVKVPNPVELIARVRYHSGAFRNARQRKLAYEALVESQEQLRQRNAEVERQRDELARQAAELSKRNRFIRATFGRYLSDDVVASLLESPDGFRLGGESRVVTILMSDLRGFTSTCERLDAEAVVRLLNNYLGAMAEVITSYRGTIDEFIGDAVLAIFGAPISAPDDAQRGIACAVAMQRAILDVNRRAVEQDLPPVEMGIAVHTGEVVVGNIGSMTRAKYGIVGSHVNLTARIESMTVGGQVLISESARLAAGAAAEVGDRIEVQAKGFKDPITAWTLVGIGGERVPDEEDPLIPLTVPIGVSVARLSGKQVEGSTFAGRIVSLASKRAEVDSSEGIDEMTNLRLRVAAEDGGEIPGDIYAKVLSRREGRFLVRFTSPPAEVETVFAGRRGRQRAG
ncbi:MAG: Chemotaxis response regulator protein-glutamate methylesterase [Thermoanaerobaculia bacterium]|nr:Chemotaxis response regulator protein-glutamate methylesterase [Thermoanaerobaculia bacterium]